MNKKISKFVTNFFISCDKKRRKVHAGVVKSVDTPGLGPGAFSHTGSSPVTRIYLRTG